jgi:hydroxymethylpyrimidine kinase/phosphomethylpyrimidine kinase
VALTIAGSDSGGGAGIQADLKTFAALGVHGTSVITCLTAQNPTRVLAVSAVAPEMIRQQLAAVFEELPPDAIKTGMLYSQRIIEEVVAFLARLPRRPLLVVDPVLIATSGARLLERQALKILKHDLLPMADLITPNVPETEALTGIAISEPEHMRKAARALHRRYGCAVLVKGGHLPNVADAVDIFLDSTTELMLSSPRLSGAKLHGTGCTYSAAITACGAQGLPLKKAVQRAKDFITITIHNSPRIGRHRVFVRNSANR